MACVRIAYHILLRAAIPLGGRTMKIHIDLPGGGQIRLERKPVSREWLGDLALIAPLALLFVFAIVLCAVLRG